MEHGFSLKSGYTKILRTPNTPLRLVLVKLRLRGPTFQLKLESKG